MGLVKEIMKKQFQLTEFWWKLLTGTYEQAEWLEQSHVSHKASEQSQSRVIRFWLPIKASTTKHLGVVLIAHPKRLINVDTIRPGGDKECNFTRRWEEKLRSNPADPSNLTMKPWLMFFVYNPSRPSLDADPHSKR